MIHPKDADASRGVINIDLVEGADSSEKVSIFGKSFPGGKITDIHDYVSQSMGDFISQLRGITVLTMGIALLIIILQ